MGGETATSLVEKYCTVKSNFCFNARESRPEFHFIPFSAKANKFNITGDGLMDSGSTYSLIPAASLPKAIINTLDQTDASVSGIAGTKVKTLGEFRALVSICGFQLPNVKFIVMDTNIPILLGQNIWQHARVDNYKINNQDGTLAMTGTVNSTKVVGSHSLKVLTAPGKLSWSMSQHCYMATDPVAEFDNESREPKVDPRSLKTLDEKLKWLKSEMNMSLSHSNRAELEEFADLVIEYRSIVSWHRHR